MIDRVDGAVVISRIQSVAGTQHGLGDLLFVLVVYCTHHWCGGMVVPPPRRPPPSQLRVGCHSGLIGAAFFR